MTSKEADMSLYNHVLEPFRRAINNDSNAWKDRAVPNNLNFSENNQSLRESINNLIGTKRKSFDTANCTPDKRKKAESPTPVTPSSPWEAKRLKIDLIAAKAQITKLEARVNHQHTIRKEMQILFEEEKTSLEEQHKRDERSLSDMEDRLQLVRRREQDVKDELAEIQKTYSDNKLKWDKEKTEFQKQIADLKDQLLEANVSSKDQISEMERDMEELLQAYQGAQSEVEMLKNEISKLTPKAEQCTTLKNQLDKQSFEVQQLNNKLKELEYEKDSYKDWQQQAKTAQKRLANMAEMEKEVNRLRATERSLRDVVCNKLLLEEQVHSLSTRLEALQPVQQELHDVKVKVAQLEADLEEWVSVGRNRGAIEPRALAAALDAALQKELLSVTECTQAQSQLAQLTEEISTIKYERDKATTKLNDLQAVRKNQESLLHRLQKRLLLVTRERDSYRQQLDYYEKELTVTLCGEAGAGSASLLSARVEQLEKALQGYRDLLDKHDNENNTKALESLRAEVSKWRDESELARCDAYKLRTQRDNLQAQIERLTGASTKVLHLAGNPADQAHKQAQKDLDAAREEMKCLKAALMQCESHRQSEEFAILRQQIDNSKLKLQRIKEEFTVAAQEYRDVIYLLFGYKVDKTGHKNYRISSMYAESAEEYLTFTLHDEGIEMVHTDYSANLGDLVDLHLHHHHSIPLFLSALTVDLYNKTTMQQESDE